MRRGVDRLLAVLGYMMAAVLVGMMMLTVVDVVGRYLFNRPIPGSSELIELMLAATVFGALPLAAARQEHILIDIMDFAIKGAVKRIQQIIVHFVGAVCLGFVAWRLMLRGMELAQFGDGTMFLSIPLAPFAFGMAVLTAFAALITAMLGVAAIGGDLHPFRGDDGDRSATQQAMS